MKIKKKSIACFIVVSIILILVLCSAPSSISMSETIFNKTDSITDFTQPSVSAVNNHDIIDSVFDYKVDDYSNYSYYSQIYDPSLQATYYALYIFDTLGKLDSINQTALVNYIMSHYESSSGRFMDSLSYRYLASDASRNWGYPYSTTLETTCYAVLSLNILNSLALIDTQGIIDYLWNCYNVDTSGFIGQPYDSNLPYVFRLSTMDNTYFAILTLDLLMDDWFLYQSEKNEIIQFINDLQVPDGPSWQAGGFFNDEDASVDSLNPLFEPNLLSSFYCIKALEVFGMEDTINIPNFHQFLSNSYDSGLDYFQIAPWEYPEDMCNIIATSLGLELSDITGFTGINRNAVVEFILAHRNSLGNWDQSTTISHHELIDIFQIIRSLENSQVIPQLTLEEKNQIGNATFLYSYQDGYTLLSKDYTSMNLVNSIIGSFELYRRIGDLDIQQLYTEIKGSYTENYQEMFTNSFTNYIIKSNMFVSLRSFPIEYYSDIETLRSHKATFYALDSLNRIFKLDDFLTEIDANELISDIIATQFLNDTYYQNYGAFTPYWPYNSYYKSSFLNSKIFLEYSYYAIRCLELLTEQLHLGNLSSLGVDTLALYTYIDRNIAESSTKLYFDPSHTSNTETILEYTYYMIYLLKAIDMYDKDSHKIITFVESHLDYGNIKNLYFSYKISETLGIPIDFDTKMTQQLIQDIYSSQYYEFYCSIDRDVIIHDNFYWICDMARNSKIEFDITYLPSIELGSSNHIEVSLDNLVLHDFGSYLTFKYESDQLGIHTLAKQPNGNYIGNIVVPLLSTNFPTIEGYLRAYEGSVVKAEDYLSFNTTYTLNYNLSVYKKLSSAYFSLNCSIVCNGTQYSLESGNASIEVYVDNTLNETKKLYHYHFTEYSVFNISYRIAEDPMYKFIVYLNDGITNETRYVGDIVFNYRDPNPNGPPDDPDGNNPAMNYESEIKMTIPLIVSFIAIPGVIIFSRRKLNTMRGGLPQK